MESISTKQKILSLLKRAGSKYVSGAEIAKELGVSRTAIWKHIANLKEAGVRIESTFKKGYHLAGGDILLPQDLEKALKDQCIGRHIVYFDEVASTNNVAKELASQGIEEGTVVLADAQGNGRGRLERSFYCPPFKGLWFSIILRPSFLPREAPKCTLLAAVAVIEAMKLHGVDAGIKWPNDILHQGKKLVGILTEMHAEIDRIKDVVIGIGIDVNFQSEDFPEDVAEVATSMAIIKGECVDRGEFLIDVLKCMDALYETVRREGFAPILDKWRNYSITLRQEVRAIRAKDGSFFTGLATDIDEDGALLIETADGVERVLAGEVSIRPLA